MQVQEPVRGTTEKRTVRWLFEKIDTLRKTIIARAGRLTRPQGKLTFDPQSQSNRWLQSVGFPTTCFSAGLCLRKRLETPLQGHAAD